MSDRAFLQTRREAEFPVFLKVLEAMPRERFDYRPHQRSPTAAGIAWTLAMETRACCALIDEGRVDWQHVEPPSDPSTILQAFEGSYRELNEKIAGLDDASWGKPAGLYANGQLAREAPLGEFLWFIFFDAIHHRGQLSTYLRPMGGKVPAIYGPSGDDPGQ